MAKELVNHPQHYGGEDNPYEVIKIIEAYNLGFHLGNTLKYILRLGKKDDEIQELKKAKWYLDRKIAELEKARSISVDTPEAPVANNLFTLRTDELYTRRFTKIPILISKYENERVKGWKAELPSDYEDWKPTSYDFINFEDLQFHFDVGLDVHDNNEYVYLRRKDAVEVANAVNSEKLGGKAKIWFV